MTNETSTTPKVTSASNLPAALIWMVIALGSFTMVAISGRAAGQNIDTMHLMFYRSIISLLIVLILVIASPTGMRQLATARLGLHLIRNTIHFVAQYSWLAALVLIPLAQLFALEFTAPLWVALLAPIFLPERLTRTRIFAAAIGFAGILIIVRPGTIALDAGTLFALMAAIGFAGSMITTKKLVRTETIFSFLFHMSWMQLIMSALPIIHDLRLPDPETLMWIGAVACFGLSAHFSLARAFTHADAIIVAPMDFLRLPLIMVVGVVLYREALQPMVLAGAAIVVVANAINIWGEHYANR